MILKKKKERADSLLSQEYLCRAMELLLLEREYSGITVTDICKKAGVSRITFYKYFASKESLTQAMTVQKLEAAWCIAEEKPGGNGILEILKALTPFSAGIRNLIRNGQTILLYGCFRDFFKSVSKEGSVSPALAGYAGGFFLVTTEWLLGGAKGSAAEMASLLEKGFPCPIPEGLSL